MSQSSLATAGAPDDNELLEVIREEQCSPTLSSVNMDAPSKLEVVKSDVNSCAGCLCHQSVENPKADVGDTTELDQILAEREATLNKEFQGKLESEIESLKQRFDYILHNEQVRSSCMLREAYRERQEKITALQGQLECKNLAGLMFVLCAERRKSQLEKLRLVEEYTGYVRALQQILAEGQALILYLSRGYKTAARVDHEWRLKMTKILSEFQAYIQHYGGGTPESNQYLLDLPAMLRTEFALYDNPMENPCDEEENEMEEPELLKTGSEDNTPWYETLEGDSRPFVMFGDMAEFRPPQRRTALKAVKAAKTAPKRWREYVFNEMYLRADCPNADVIKDEYPARFPHPSKWECMGVQTDKRNSRSSIASRRMTTASIDARGNMGSILKIITSTAGQPNGDTKATLLGARDSMEIASTTKVRERHRHSGPGKVVINIGNRRESLLNELEMLEDEDEPVGRPYGEERQIEVNEGDEVEDESVLGAVVDSIQVIASHVPNKDKVNNEKVCPMEACQRMEMGSFVRSLPPYMRSSPFLHFENTFDDYETCSPEQLQILKQRIEEKKRKEKADHHTVEDPFLEWDRDVTGVGVQTSQESLPPCTCGGPSPTPVSSAGRIFNIEDLIPVKQTIDEIRREFFYDADIEFDRFRVVGQRSKENTVHKDSLRTEEEFAKKRMFEINNILKQHPSLCDIFQANTRC